MLYNAYSSDSDTLEIQTLSVQQQQGNKDCGVFSIATAVELCNGNNPETARFDQSQLRSHLIKCFTNQKLVSFPKQDSDPLPRPLRRCYQVNIFCHCRMPEDYDEEMILCDSCETWFHCLCAGVTEDKIPDTWMFKMCIWFTNWPVVKNLTCWFEAKIT